jgi:hypothetical protein
VRNLPELLRAAERRVNAHVWPNRPETRGADDHLASIPANRDTDTDLLLIEAADKIERIQTAFQALRDGAENANSKLYRVLMAEFPNPDKVTANDGGAENGK